jgi:hypothetical protein
VEEKNKMRIVVEVIQNGPDDVSGAKYSTTVEIGVAA